MADVESAKFRSPLHPERMAVKRVVALEGDTVSTKAPYPFARETVPVGHVWVEGEHPENSRKSYDSNSYGPVSAVWGSSRDGEGTVVRASRADG